MPNSASPCCFMSQHWLAIPLLFTAIPFPSISVLSRCSTQPCSSVTIQSCAMSYPFFAISLLILALLCRCSAQLFHFYSSRSHSLSFLCSAVPLLNYFFATAKHVVSFLCRCKISASRDHAVPLLCHPCPFYSVPLLGRAFPGCSVAMPPQFLALPLHIYSVIATPLRHCPRPFLCPSALPNSASGRCNKISIAAGVLF